MKKTIITMAAGALVAGTAMSTPVFDFQFNQDGNKLSQAVDDSANNYVWNGTHKSGGTDIVTAGGNYPMLNADNASKKVLGLNLTSGIVTNEIRFSSWAMDNNNTTDNLSFKLNGSGGNIAITWGGAGDGTDARLRSAGTSGGKNITLSGNSGTSLTLQLIANLNDGSYTAAYDIGGGLVDMTGSNGANGITDITDAIFAVSAADGNQWTAEGNDDFANVDYIKLEVIPEPATTGLMGLTAFGLFLARNRTRSRADTIIRKLERRG